MSSRVPDVWCQSRSVLFKPYRIGALEARNRITKSPTNSTYTDECDIIRPETISRTRGHESHKNKFPIPLERESMDKSKTTFTVGLIAVVTAALLMMIAGTKADSPYFATILGVCGISLIVTSGFRLLK